MILNALTIDVEDYFHIHALSGVISPDTWHTFRSTVERNTHRILDLIDSAGSGSVRGKGQPRGTFFILGWVADRYPSLVREIRSRGHEIACHGYSHQCIYNQTPDEFRKDITRAKQTLEDIIGEDVQGYRAPTYSVTRETLWALEIIAEAGFLYDSSIFPVAHDLYGISNAPRFPFLVTKVNGASFESRDLRPIKRNNRDAACALQNIEKPSGAIIELPLTTIKFLNRNIPVGGGGYFRLFPYSLTRAFLSRFNASEERPFIFYLHPWEIDKTIPKVPGAGMLSRFRTYVNLELAQDRFKRLLADFGFTTMAQVCASLVPQQETRVI